MEKKSRKREISIPVRQVQHHRNQAGKKVEEQSEQQKIFFYSLSVVSARKLKIIYN
jgi:hypothetical protein